MFVVLKPYAKLFPGRARYTLFILTSAVYPDVCREQDEAVAQIKKHADNLNLNVIEIRIHG